MWDACSDAMITFSSADILDDDVAYIVENDVLLHAVNTELNKSKNIETVYQAKIAGYQLSQTEDDENIVKMTNGDTYSCDLLVSQFNIYFHNSFKRSKNIWEANFYWQRHIST